MVIDDAITPDSTINDDLVMGMNKGENGIHAKGNGHAQSYSFFICAQPPLPWLA